jgi:DNA-damage-inducible protein D
MPKQSVAPDAQNLDALKKSNEYSAKYWSARDLQSMLGYSQWRRFEDAIKRAMISCETSGNDPAHHFAGTGKMIEVGKGAIRIANAQREPA